MRCYFMQDGHITAVEVLTQADDAGLIEQSRTAFDRLRETERCQGFEVWDGKRRIYRYPEDERYSSPSQFPPAGFPT